MVIEDVVTVIVGQLIKVIDTVIVPILISNYPFIKTFYVVPAKVKSEVEIVNV